MKTHRLIVLGIALGLTLAAIVQVVPAQAGTYTDPASRTAQTGRVDCTTTSATLRPAADRGMIAFTTTAGSGIVYITADATVGATAAADGSNSFPLANGSSWDNELRPYYSGAFRCAAKSGTVTVFYVEVK